MTTRAEQLFPIRSYHDEKSVLHLRTQWQRALLVLGNKWLLDKPAQKLDAPRFV